MIQRAHFILVYVGESSLCSAACQDVQEEKVMYLVA